MFTAAVSLENPATLVSGTAVPGTLYNNPGAGNSFTPPNGATFSANNVTVDYLPDIVAKVAIDPGFGHYELFATERFFRARDIITGQLQNVKTNATGFGGNLIIPVVPKMIDFQASFIGGRGVGRYGSAQLPDATVNPDSTHGLDPLRGFSALAGLTYKPAPAWTFYGYVGEEQVSSRSYTALVAGKPGRVVPVGLPWASLAWDSGCRDDWRLAVQWELICRAAAARPRKKPADLLDEGLDSAVRREVVKALGTAMSSLEAVSPYFCSAWAMAAFSVRYRLCSANSGIGLL